MTSSQPDTEGAAADRAVATALAAEVQAEPGWRSWRKVTTLLDRFGLYRLTPAGRARIAGALAGAGLHADPAIEDAHLHQTVRLSLEGAAEGRVSTLQGLAATHMIRVFEWAPREQPREIGLADAASSPHPIWIDLDVLTIDADDAAKAVARICGPSASRELVDDLLSADPRPKVVRLPGDSARLVASLHIEAEDRADERESKAGRLVFRPVEIAVGEGWLITCRHTGGVYEGAGETGGREPLALETLVGQVEGPWRKGPHHASAADLGMLILDALATTYRPAHRELYAWLETWELDFNDRVHETEQHTLKDLRGLLSLMRVRLLALSPAHDEPGDAWFGNLSDGAVAYSLDRKLERALRQLDAIAEMLRSSFQVLTTAGTAEHLRLAQEQSEHSQRLDERITVITALLLVPTLIVGLYGANTSLPGKETWSGFEVMVALIVLSAITTLVLLRRARRK